MADNKTIITQSLEANFRAVKRGDPILPDSSPSSDGGQKTIPSQNYSRPEGAKGALSTESMTRYASGGLGTIFGQPQFFSPVHTPINWQIPSKRLEQYQWARFFYENEPKVAAGIDFYSYFPMNDYAHECKDPDVVNYFDKLKDRLELPKWLRLMSHEIHLLGDCFPFIEISCPHCGGSGRVGDEICEHEGGTVKRMIILNPDYIEVHTSSLNPDPIISMKPDEELINMVNGKTPGYERLTPEVRALIASGQPIRLDNRSVSHLKYGEGGYSKYGSGMIKRLFPILAYKTKLMVAQWIVAERLIVPIKIVKVGSEERPAGAADIAAVQEQLAATANDPNMTIVTHHAFELDWYGASGKVLTLSNEFDFINQEILDGMMINNALLNGEGPNYSSASIGIESMIERLESFRREIAKWVEQQIYLPEAMRQAEAGRQEFVEVNEDTGEVEYMYPRIKWNSMHLRDQQQYRQTVLQLYEKGLLSAQTVLEVFDFDPDVEIERKRYDALQMNALGMGMEGGGGGMGGGFGGDMGGMPGMEGDMGGGDMGDMGGGDMGDMGGGDMGGGGGGDMAGAEARSDNDKQLRVAQPVNALPQEEMIGQLIDQLPDGDFEIEKNRFDELQKSALSMGDSITKDGSDDKQISVGQIVEPANPENYGGKILKEKSRSKFESNQKKTLKQNEEKNKDQKHYPDGQTRDEKGRVIFTEPERELLGGLVRYVQDGLISYRVVPQFPVQCNGVEYPLDFAIPQLKIAIEADGEMFHSNPKQLKKDKERDAKMAQLGWTTVRFKDTEIKNKIEQVMQTILKAIMKKEKYYSKVKQDLDK